MIHDIIQGNFLTFIVTAFIATFVAIDHGFDRPTRRIFGVSITLVVLLMAAGVVGEYYKDSGFSLVLGLSAATERAVRPATILALILTMLREEKRPRLKWLLSAPIIVNWILSFLSIWNGWYFYYDEAMVRRLGPLGLVPFVMSGVYMVLVIVLALKATRRLREDNEWILAIFIALSSTIATISEAAFKYKYMLTGTIAVANCAYYMYIHVQVYKRDSLTRLLNRHNLEFDINDLGSSSYVCTFIDIDDFKQINDRYGHEAGDDALVLVARYLRKYKPEDSRVYRYGGDEFVVITPGKSRTRVDGMITSVMKKLEEYGMSISFGLAVRSEGESFDEVCDRADKDMYANKRKYKHIRRRHMTDSCINKLRKGRR